MAAQKEDSHLGLFPHREEVIRGLRHMQEHIRGRGSQPLPMGQAPARPAPPAHYTEGRRERGRGSLLAKR